MVLAFLLLFNRRGSELLGRWRLSFHLLILLIGDSFVNDNVLLVLGFLNISILVTCSFMPFFLVADSGLLLDWLLLALITVPGVHFTDAFLDVIHLLNQ